MKASELVAALLLLALHSRVSNQSHQTSQFHSARQRLRAASGSRPPPEQSYNRITETPHVRSARGLKQLVLPLLNDHATN